MPPTLPEGYSGTWLSTTAPDEDLVLIAGHAYSEVYIGAKSRRVFKVTSTKEWFRYAWVLTRDGETTVL